MDLATVTSQLQLLSSFLVAVTGVGVAAGAILSKISKPFHGWLTKKLSGVNVAHINQRLDEYKDTFELYRTQQTLMKEGMLAMLRNALTDIWHRAEEAGYISDYDRENFEKMYAAYSALGGNSYIHEVHKQILKLPSKPPRKHRKTTAKKTAKRAK